MNDIANVIARLEQQRTKIDTAISALRSLQGTQPTPSKAAAAPRKRRRMSAEGRKRIADAVRKRWADKRAAEAKKVKK
jgi:hypothetical protein